MPTLSLRTLAVAFVVVFAAGVIVITATGASVAYVGTLIFFSVAAIGIIALLDAP